MAKTNTPTTDTTNERPTTMEEMDAYFAAKQKELDDKLAQLNSQQEALAAQEQELKAQKQSVAAKPMEDQNDMKRKVKVTLPLDSLHKEPLHVRVNDYTCIIKRGVQVEIPYFVYLAIKENEDADAKTLMLLDDLNRKFTSKADQYKI
ncbi:MAG: hypothetical protein E7319_02205 [Clostridiales bacterium]|nr:hypothetical protein [Clostridiales bacterium]